MIVNVCEAGLATEPPLVVPATVSVVSGASTSLLVAVIVTVPVEVVAPAAMVSDLLVDKAYTLEPLAVVAATVTVTSSFDLPDSCTVPVLAGWYHSALQQERGFLQLATLLIQFACG